ncbi:50S ribosomal protein L29 [Candidatus Uhrbacteria bacterium]|nr:50S ribosomal protein L29 [Candidatus Uhrbacteria bacterium]
MKNQFVELKEKSETELRKLLAEDREKLRDLRFRVSQGAHKAVRDIRKLKLRIARILTVLTMKKS